MNLEQSLCKYNTRFFFFWQATINFPRFPVFETFLVSILTSIQCLVKYCFVSGLFVIVSWISFLIPMDVIPGRMALLVTLFLVLVNIFNTVTTNTPKAEGLTAIEAWMLACILFVFGALIEWVLASISCFTQHVKLVAPFVPQSKIILKWIRSKNPNVPFISVLRTKIPNMGHSHWTLSACPQSGYLLAVLKQEAGALLLLPSIFAAS